MRLTQVLVKNFRSIDNLTLDVGELAVFCGPNSCGKSNLFRALLFAFEPQASLTNDVILLNLPAAKRNAPGGHPSIQVELTFAECPPELHEVAETTEGRPIKYIFRASRSGVVTRKLGDSSFVRGESGTPLLASLRSVFHIQYVPPIRDLTAGGMKPFKELLAETLRQSRITTSLAGPERDARQVLTQKGGTLLSDHLPFVTGTLQAQSLSINTDAVSLDALYEKVSFDVMVDGQAVPLHDIGTGHQSALIIHLHRQFGEGREGHTLFLFEEPETNLHPATVRAIGNDLKKLAEDASAQVFITTHSPVLIGHMGFDVLHPLRMSDERRTECRPMNLAGYSDRQLRARLQRYGIRLTEPLLSRRIIICEGGSDVVVLSRLIERWNGGVHPDQLDLVLIPAEGAAGVAEIAHLLSRMDVDWRCVLDWDTVYSGRSPMTKSDATTADRTDADTGLDALLRCLEPDRRNGRLRRTIGRLKTELTQGRPDAVLYEGSKLQRLLEGDDCPSPITSADRAALKDELVRGRVTKYQPILNGYSVWLWRSDLEGEMLWKDGAADVVELFLVVAGVLPNMLPANDQRIPQLRATLHGEAQDPVMLQGIVDQLDVEGYFNRSQLKKAVAFLTEGIT